MDRPLSTWELGLVERLVSIEGPPDGPDATALRESLPYLVVTGGCGCGCPSFFVRDSRVPVRASEGTFHFSNAVSEDGQVGAFLRTQGDRLYSVDIELPPDIEGASPQARPDPRSMRVTSPYSG